MSPTHIAKRLARLVKVSWREQPTRFDIEAMQANVRRVGLVIRMRWALVAALTVFSLLAAGAYAAQYPWGTFWPNMVIPAGALVFVLLYNTYYQLTYRYLGNIAILNHAQLLFDAVVVTVLVYYSGGVHSWFWAMYPLFVLEAAFILPSRRDAWFVAGVCITLVGFVVWGEYLGILPHIDMPYITESHHADFTFVAVRYLWQVTLISGTVTVATLMTGAIKQREKELAATSIVDDTTGLYDRRYFLRALGSEMLRAEHDGRAFHVLLVDIDRFGQFNRLVGIERGNRMLKLIGTSIGEAVEDGSDLTPNVASRYGGEEFALLFSETANGSLPTVEDALALAHAVRSGVENLREGDAGVTASIGVASYPEDGTTIDDLLDAADEALHIAKTSGGNTVRARDRV